MSRRSQSRRRRTYGRRQHEVRERRPTSRADVAWLGDGETDIGEGWQPADVSDEQPGFGDSFASYAQ